MSPSRRPCLRRHISIGWNVGQLMYVLLLNGFDVAAGRFIEHGYNVCSPQDAIRTVDNSGLKNLAMGKYLLTKKQ